MIHTDKQFSFGAFGRLFLFNATRAAIRVFYKQ